MLALAERKFCTKIDIWLGVLVERNQLAVKQRSVM
jgi:hypothetical protein